MNVICDRQVQMKRLTLVVDERELSTIQAALLLLQEQVNALPEDLADMLSGHGPAMTEKEIGKLSHRLAFGQNKLGLVDGARMAGRLVEVDRSPSATMALK
jgi:hypothetical protein